MRGQWHLTKFEKKIYPLIIKWHIMRLENEIVDKVEFTRMNINPYQLQEMLEDMGYYQDYFETNGWEQDCWAGYKKEGHTPITIFSCGMTFDLTLYRSDED